MGKQTVTDIIFLGSKVTVDGDCSHEIKIHLLLGRKAMTNINNILKSRDFVNKGLSSQSYGFSSSHVRMVLQKTLESSLDCKEIQPVRPKGNES